METSLPRSAYWDDAYFAREVERIFRDQWLYAGPAERIAEVGAYCVLDVAGESVILVRDKTGPFAHLNFCRHRGSRLLDGVGCLRGAIRCPYHAWAYALDGRLVASPFVDDVDVPETARRLHPVAIAEWEGFLFVHLAPGAPTASVAALGAALGEVPQRVARYPLAELRVARTIEYDVAANWKVILENYNECYHCAGVHPELCRVVPAFKTQGGAALDWDRGIPHRDGAWTFTESGTTSRAPFTTLDDDERVRHKGELIYPNFMLSLAAEHVAAFCLLPQSPSKTTVRCDFLFHPSETEKPGFDPSDAVEFWNVVNEQDWRICERVQQGMRSRSFDFGYYAPMEDASLDIRRYITSRLT
jgi:Rieske 2Fe-2S family protein